MEKKVTGSDSLEIKADASHVRQSLVRPIGSIAEQILFRALFERAAKAMADLKTQGRLFASIQRSVDEACERARITLEQTGSPPEAAWEGQRLMGYEQDDDDLSVEQMNEIRSIVPQGKNKKVCSSLF